MGWRAGLSISWMNLTRTEARSSRLILAQTHSAPYTAYPSHLHRGGLAILAPQTRPGAPQPQAPAPSQLLSDCARHATAGLYLHN